jgi:hypothetical protein
MAEIIEFWELFTSDNTYDNMCVLEKKLLFELVVSYWVRQNVINPTKTYPSQRSHVGKTYQSIQNIVTDILSKTEINFDEFKKEFKEYVKSTEFVNETNDKHIQAFRTHFGFIKNFKDLSLTDQKNMYCRIIDFWINNENSEDHTYLKKINEWLCNKNDIYDNFIIDCINDITPMTIKYAKDCFRKYIAGVTEIENSKAVMIRKKKEFEFPREFYIEKQ